MKAKFKMGFLTGFKNVAGAWPGVQHIVPILEPGMVVVGGDHGYIESPTPHVKSMVFECRRIDDDHAAVFEFMEIR